MSSTRAAQPESLRGGKVSSASNIFMFSYFLKIWIIDFKSNNRKTDEVGGVMGKLNIK
jgi:hypothetical protein